MGREPRSDMLISPDETLNMARERVLKRLAVLKATLSAENYTTLVAELIRMGKEQGGREEAFWCGFEDEHCPPTEWRKQWEVGLVERPAEAARWLRGRSETVKELALRFPPSCIVRGLIPLRCPSPGNVGIVSTYLERSDLYPLGRLGVLAHPEGRVVHGCCPEELEVVGYFKGLTPKLLAELLVRQTQ